MNKKQNNSPALMIAGLLFFAMGGIAWVLFAMVFADSEHLAVPIAAILAAIGGVLLILNAVIHPESIPRPDVKTPEININLPPEIGVYHRPQKNHTGRNTKIPGVINVDEWPIVSVFKSDGQPLTKRQQIRGTVCCLLWIAVLAGYFLVSFTTGRWEITWIIFFGAAFIHVLIYSLFTIGEQK